MYDVLRSFLNAKLFLLVTNQTQNCQISIRIKKWNRKNFVQIQYHEWKIRKYFVLIFLNFIFHLFKVTSNTFHFTVARSSFRFVLNWWIRINWKKKIRWNHKWPCETANQPVWSDFFFSSVILLFDENHHNNNNRETTFKVAYSQFKAHRL